MKPLLHGMIILLMLCVTTVARGVTIEGPDKCRAGETVAVRISDVAFDLDGNATLADIWQAVRRVQIQHEDEVLSVEVRMKFTAKGVQLILEAEVTPTQEGTTFVLAIDRTDTTLLILPAVIHTIEVGKGDDPVPPIPPIPPEPDPPEKGDRYLLFLLEKKPPKGTTRAQMAVRAGWANLVTLIRQAEAKGDFKGHTINVMDDDVTEEAYARFLAARKNDDITPTLFILELKTGKELWSGPSPKGLAEIKSLLTEHGG